MRDGYTAADFIAISIDYERQAKEDFDKSSVDPLYRATLYAQLSTAAANRAMAQAIMDSIQYPAQPQ